MDTSNNGKGNRRKSPVPTRKHVEKTGSNSGAINLAVSVSSAHLSPTASNLNLPVTPSAQSSHSAVDDRSVGSVTHINNPLGSESSQITVRMAEDQTAEEDPVVILLSQIYLLNFQNNRHFIICFTGSFISFICW